MGSNMAEQTNPQQNGADKINDVIDIAKTMSLSQLLFVYSTIEYHLKEKGWKVTE